MLHGVRTYILQSKSGQITETHSVSAGLDYPGVGPEHAWLKDSGRAEYVVATDEQALRGFRMLTQLEGIIPALESSHAIWEGVRLASTLPADQDIVIVRLISVIMILVFLTDLPVSLWTWRQRRGADLAIASWQMGGCFGLACIYTLDRTTDADDDSINLVHVFHGRLPDITSISIQSSSVFIMPGDVQAAAYQRNVEALVSKLRRRYVVQKTASQIIAADLIAHQTNRWLEEGCP